MNKNGIGERFRLARKHAKLTQEELAVAFGCTQSLISSIEKGDSQPSLQLVAWIVQRVGTTTDWLILDRGLGPGGQMLEPGPVYSQQLDGPSIAATFKTMDSIESLIGPIKDKNLRASIFNTLYRAEVAGEQITIPELVDIINGFDGRQNGSGGTEKSHGEIS